jgi:alginate O-acetyltransferase complex protein AlgI
MIWQFTSQNYLLFFAAVFVVHWLLPWTRARVLLLVAASLFFYSCWSVPLAVVVAGSALAVWGLGLGMSAAEGRPGLRRGLLIAGVVGNLGLLAFFRYMNFFLDSLRAAAGVAGAEVSLPALEILAPVGISFYTFEAISYLADVHAGKIPAERHPDRFLLFILFFPHLLAGPIVRARDFLFQTRRERRFHWLRAQVGVEYFLMGMFKKTVLADRMALFSDPVFADPGAFDTPTVWAAVIAYTIRIYGDFSGYSDMALGSAHLLGFTLTRNFDMPYLAADISAFWRRWHISLSSWLRDYLYIPLGGNRGGPLRTMANLMITMTLGGLWHGASWTFVLWGVYHGLLLAGHRMWRGACGRVAVLETLSASPAGWVAGWALTLVAVAAGWVLFRSPDLGVVGGIFEGLTAARDGRGWPMPPESFHVLLTVTVVCHAIGAFGLWERWSPRLPAPLVGLGYAVLLTLNLVLTPGDAKEFIYFQF